MCGYNLTGVAIGSVCPECGSGVDQSLFASGQSAPTNGKAITSMVLGICSIVTCCCPGLLLAILGLIFGSIAMGEIKSGQYAQNSQGFALAGLWCSGIGLVLSGGYWLMAVLN